MAHLFQEGFFVRQPAWHGLGTVVQDYPGMEEAMKLAGHDHQIITLPVGIVGGETLTGWKALIRQDTGSVVNIANSSYEVIQNRVPWEVIDQLFSAGAKFDTAGILKGRFDEQNREVRGQVYWTLALLDEPNTVIGDNSPTYPYLAATWSHDGSQSLRFRAMAVRIVCANTHHAAMYGTDGMDLDVSIRHFGQNIEKRVEKASQAIQLARASFRAYLDAANELAKISVNDSVIARFIETIVPMPDAAIITDRVRANVMKSREQVLAVFNSPTMTGIRNTAYGLVEAGVEYFDHVRRSLTSDSYFTRNVLKTDACKMALVETARELAMAS